jgi:hypothetical protein
MPRKLGPGRKDSISYAQIRKKNGDIRVETLREIYGEDFARGLLGDVTLYSLLNRTGCVSLPEYLKKAGDRSNHSEP